MTKRTDGTTCNQLGSLLQHGNIAIAQVDHADQLLRAGQIRHLPRIGSVGRQGLFTQDVLARGHQGHRGRMVRSVRRHVGCSVKIAPGNCLFQRCEAVRNGEGVAELGEHVRALVDAADDFNAVDP